MGVRRLVLLAVLTLPAAVAAPGTAEAAHGLQVDAAPVYVRDGLAHVRLRCRDTAECSGTIRADGRRTRFGLVADEAGYVAVRVRRPARRLTLRLRAGTRPRTVRRSTVRRRDPRTCGYGLRATTIATGMGARMLRVDLGGGDEYAADTIVVACSGAVPTVVAAESTAGFVSETVTASAVGANWAAVTTRTMAARSGTVSLDLRVRSLRGPSRSPEFGLGIGDAYDGTDPLPEDPAALVVTQDGAVAFVQQGVVRAVGTTGPRVLDLGPGVVPTSLAVSGSTVTWLRDGTPQTAPLDGPAQD